jgi:hypothetical protein
MKILLMIFFLFLINPFDGKSQEFTKEDTIAKNLPDSITNNPQKFGKYLKSRFQSDEKITRALYVWLACNIRYDLDLIDSGVSKIKTDDLILNTLKTKKGICQNYAAIFDEVSRAAGIRTYKVEGYTKSFGVIETQFGHVWNIAKIDSNWYLIDATWGAGYTRHERFHKKFSFKYYKTPPDSLIKSHMPFDPMWQMMDFPATHDDFFAGNTRGRTYMNYKDSLTVFDKLPQHRQFRSSLKRAELNPVSMPELTVLFNNFRNYYSGYSDKFFADQYNNAINEYNNAVNNLNKYYSLRSQGSKDQKKLNSLIDIAAKNINQSKLYLKKSSADVVPKERLNKLKAEIQRIEKQISQIKGSSNTTKIIKK